MRDLRVDLRKARVAVVSYDRPHPRQVETGVYRTAQRAAHVSVAGRVDARHLVDGALLGGKDGSAVTQLAVHRPDDVSVDASQALRQLSVRLRQSPAGDEAVGVLHVARASARGQADGLDPRGREVEGRGEVDDCQVVEQRVSIEVRVDSDLVGSEETDLSSGERKRAVVQSGDGQ